MARVLVDLEFLEDIDISKFNDLNKTEIEFLICANKSIDTFNLRKKLTGFNYYIFEPTLYVDDENDIKKLKQYFLKNTNSDFIVSCDEFEKFKISATKPEMIGDKKLSLAFFSPLPNEKSGISFYSSELLEGLVKYYDITIIVDNPKNIDENIRRNYNIEDVNFFLTKSKEFDRIVYHIGNSPFHIYMYDILMKNEGVVVLHDFFISDLVYMAHIKQKVSFYEELYCSNGYKALSFFKKNGLKKTISKFPVNKSLIDHSLSIVTHSNEPQRLLELFYAYDGRSLFDIIPLLRKPANLLPKSECKNKLGLAENKIIICSFGYIGPSKLTLEIIKSFKNTMIYGKNEAFLAFVGDSVSSEYMALIEHYIKENELQDKIRITGWNDDEVYRTYLNACDIAIQLRTNSRGETSAAALDCLNYTLPTIVNKHGSFRDIPENCVYFIDETLNIDELSIAIDKLCYNETLRASIANSAKNIMDKFHGLEFCAKRYFELIEAAYAKKPLLKNMINDFKESKSDLIALSRAISSVKIPLLREKTIFVDITAVYLHDLKTGIQRVVRAQLLMLLDTVKDYRIEPVYFDAEIGKYFYAKDFMRNFYDIKEWDCENELIEIHKDDIFYVLDYALCVTNAFENGFFNEIRAKGARVFFMIYDLIPILHPNFFPAEISVNHSTWLKTAASSADGLICISQAVAGDVKNFIFKNGLKMPPVIKSIKLGCDIKATAPSYGLDKDSIEILDKIRSKPTFIMVGTLEPRKGHDAATMAFETLWRKGIDINLVIAGKVGWMVDELYEKIKKHEENGKRLIYLNFVSDELLDEIYKNSSCLIAASRAEGFGLPLVEAAIHKIPIIARELNVFKEVSNGSATFFKDDDDLAGTIERWLEDFKEDKHIKSDLIELVSWRQSTEQAYQILTGEL